MNLIKICWKNTNKIYHINTPETGGLGEPAGIEAVPAISEEQDKN